MLLYNVTIKIEPQAEQEWLQWMKEKHVPDILNTGMFTGAHIGRLLDPPEEDHSTYVIQYRCESREKYDNYISRFAGPLRDEFNMRFKDRFVAFRTLLEIV